MVRQKNLRHKNRLELFGNSCFLKLTFVSLICFMFLPGCGSSNLYESGRETLDQKYPPGLTQDAIVQLCNSRVTDSSDPSGFINKQGPIRIDKKIDLGDPIWNDVSHNYLKKCVNQLEEMGMSKPVSVYFYRHYTKVLDWDTYYTHMYYNEVYLFFDDSNKLICSFERTKRS